MSRNASKTRQNTNVSPEHGQGQLPTTMPKEDNQTRPDETNNEHTRCPSRVRKKPGYLCDFVLGDESNNQVLTNIDYCYKLMYDIAMKFTDAVTSPDSKDWVNAMDEEMQSLRENDTVILTNLPEGKKAVGDDGCMLLKIMLTDLTKYKPRYVANGYSQNVGVDYDETFSPTANLTSIRVLMQKTAQENLILHQIDVQTAYLHAPIDCEIYLEQPEGSEVKSNANEKLLYKLQKSLYGLKPSGRNWNKTLTYDYLSEIILHKTLLIIVFTQVKHRMRR